MTTTANTIKAGQTLTARSICDYNCIFTAKVIERKNSMVTVIVNGEKKRCKVKVGYDGGEYIMAMGTYSMAPVFKA